VETINKPETEVRIDLDLSHEELDATILEEVRGGSGISRFGLRANGVEILQFAVGGP
jgi:hypothetical protein